MKKIQNLLGMSTIKFLQVLSCGLVGLSLITFWGMRGSNFKDFCPQRPKMKAIPEDLLPKYSEMPGKVVGGWTVAWYRERDVRTCLLWAPVDLGCLDSVRDLA